MDARSMLDQIEADGQRIVAIAGADPDMAVPSCPGWTLTDLAGHVGRVHNNVSAHIRTRATERVPAARIGEPPTGRAAVDYARDALVELLDALAGIDPATEIWTWSTQHDAAFYYRRMVHETAVHRWDAENAAGEVGPIDADQGADGVDEFFSIVLPFVLARAPAPLPSRSLHVHRTDGQGEWMITADGDAIVVERVHAKGDAALRGVAMALFLAVWGRVAITDLELFGDGTVAQAWLDLAP